MHQLNGSVRVTKYGCDLTKIARITCSYAKMKLFQVLKLNSHDDFKNYLKH